MKISIIEIHTDLGRRVIQISPPLDVDPTGPMPAPFLSLPDLMWSVLHQVATQGAELAKNAPPKAEA